MYTVNTREAGNIADKCIDMGKPCIILGSPGIGKDAIIESKVKKRGLGLLIFEGPSLDLTDPRGVVVPKGKHSVFTTSPMMPWPEIHGKEGILLIDELPSALPSVQPALHSLFHPKERRLGTDKLPPKWIPWATGNYVTDGAGAYNIQTALADRACIINVVSEFLIWKEDFAYLNNIHPSVIGYLNFQNDHLNTFEKRNKAEKGKTFATPRSWVEVSDFMWNAEGLSKTAMTAIVGGYVGEGLSTSFMEFLEVYHNLPDVDAILRGKYNGIPDKLDILHALVGALVSKLINLPEGLKLSVAIESLFEYSKKLPAEFCILTVKDAMVKFMKEVQAAKGWTWFVKTHKEVIL